MYILINYAKSYGSFKYFFSVKIILALFPIFLQISFVYSLKLNSSSISIPRYLYDFFIGIPSNSFPLNLYYLLSPTFLIKIIPDLPSFSFILFVFVHSFYFFIAFLRRSMPSPAFTISSAYAIISNIACNYIITIKFESAIMLKFVGELKDPCISTCECFH